MRATTIHAPRDIRVSDVPDPTIEAPDRRHRQGGGRLHLRLGPVALPRRERHHARLDDRPRVRGRGRGGRGRGAGLLARRLRHRAVLPLRQHLRALPGRGAVGVHPPGLHRAAARPSTPWSARPTAAWSGPTACPDGDLIPSLLTLSDVMATGWHAAVAAGVREGGTAVVVGDGAVGLCGVLAASVMGAEKVIAMSRHEPRQKIATRVRRHPHRRGARQGGGAGGQGDHRGSGRRRGARVRRHRPTR